MWCGQTSISLNTIDIKGFYVSVPNFHIGGSLKCVLESSWFCLDCTRWNILFLRLECCWRGGNLVVSTLLSSVGTRRRNTFLRSVTSCSSSILWWYLAVFNTSWVIDLSWPRLCSSFRVSSTCNFWSSTFFNRLLTCLLFNSSSWDSFDSLILNSCLSKTFHRKIYLETNNHINA